MHVMCSSALPINGLFCIKKLDNVDTCGAAMRTSRNPRMSSDMVGKGIGEQIHSEPLMRPIKVVRDFKNNYGLDISYHHAWHSVERARNEMYGDHVLSFDQLRWYTEEALRVNLGNHIVLEVGENDNRFRRLFVSFYVSIVGFKFIRPVIYLDGTFLKSRYKVNVLAAIGKYGNGGMICCCQS